jgi:hypothetical protein
MTSSKHPIPWFRRTIQGGVASALALVGLVAFAAPAFAHNNTVSAVDSCAQPLGTGYVVTWTISNDYNEPETGSVTSVTDGASNLSLSTLNSSNFSIAATPGATESTATLTQTLPAGTALGTLTMNIDSKWTPDGYSRTDSGTFSLASSNCAAPVQTIGGHIYLCNDSNPTTTEESGGTLAATGPQSISSTSNPLAPTNVEAGDYTMTANAPAGYTLVVCGGSSTPSGSGTSATESVTVPSGGAGVGDFYVTPITQTIAGHIYLCNAGTKTTTEESGGTLAATGPQSISSTSNPLAPTNVEAGDYTMTANAPAGYTLVVCGGSSTPSGSGTSATESVTVPSGGAGVGDFYVTPTITVLTSPVLVTPVPAAPVLVTPTVASPVAVTSPSPDPLPAAAPAASALAFTGASLASELKWAGTLLLLGIGLLTLSRRMVRKVAKNG